MIDILSCNIRLDRLFIKTILCPQFFSVPYRKAVEFLSRRCPGSRLFLWEPRGRDLCDNMAGEPALYGHDKDPSDTSVHQIDSGSGDKRGSFAFDPLISWWLFGDSQLILIRLPTCVTCCWDKGGCGRRHNHPLVLKRAWMWNAIISFWSQWLLARSEMLWAMISDAVWRDV